MATAAARPLQFCKLFLPQHLSQRLRIPPAFVKHLAAPPPVTVSLKGPGGGVWRADLVAVSGDFFLDAGWKDFIHDHSLQQWDFLVFRYDGNALFDVLVFDRSLCGKEAALSARPSQDRGGNAGQEPVFPGPSEDTGNVEPVLVRPSEDNGNAGEEGFSARASDDGDREQAVLGAVIVKRKRGRPKRHNSDTLLVEPTGGRDTVGEATLPVGRDNADREDSADVDKDGEGTILVRPSEDRGNAREEGFSARASDDGDREEDVMDRVIVKRKRGRPKRHKSDTLSVEPSVGRDTVGEATLLVRPTDGGKEDTLAVGRDNEDREDSKDGDKDGDGVRPSEDRGNAREEGFSARMSADGDREEAVMDGVIVKRKRGRPKKSKSDDCDVMERLRKELVEGQKRTRGRPRKEPMEGQKRRRGRPRKNVSDRYVNPEGILPLKETTPCKEDHLARGSSFSTPPPPPNLVKKHDTHIESNATMLHSRVPSMHPTFADYERMPPTGEILVKEKRQYGVRSQRRPVTSEEVDKVILKAKAFNSEYPFCVVQMYDSYVYYGFALGIPPKFARKHLPLPGGNVILCDPSGKRWDVKYVIYRRHGCFNAGWLKFSVTNNLERGDVCVFELIKSCELRVHIFRVVEELTPLIRAFQGRRKRSSKG